MGAWNILIIRIQIMTMRLKPVGNLIYLMIYKKSRLLKKNLIIVKRTRAQKGRKGKTNPVTRKSNNRKQKCLSGMEYTSKCNILIPAKALEPSCQEKCTKATIGRVISTFGGYEKKVWQNWYQNQEESSNKKIGFTVNNPLIQVCKTFFLNTLGILQKFVSKALSKKM